MLLLHVLRESNGESNHLFCLLIIARRFTCQPHAVTPVTVGNHSNWTRRTLSDIDSVNQFYRWIFSFTRERIQRKFSPSSSDIHSGIHRTRQYRATARINFHRLSFSHFVSVSDVANGNFRVNNDNCRCQCLPHLDTFREDLNICVDDIHGECLSPRDSIYFSITN